MFVWLRLPGDLSADTLLPLAVEAGVDFMPGSSFYPDGTDDRGWLRLNFVVQPVEEIDEGIRRLGEAIRRLEAGG